MKKQRIFIAITAILVAVIAYLLWHYSGTPKPKTLQEAMPVTTYTLSNGLTLVVVENHRVPAVSHTMFVKVGGADDPVGTSGLAHYLEHLLFKGTPTVNAEEYDRRIASMGANTNAFTTSDYTAYYVNAPVESLEQIMTLESDRFMNIVIDDHAADTERKVIEEERRMRVENNPSSQLGEQVEAVRFMLHPYRIPIIGFAQDIAAFKAADARKFFAAHYVPRAMVLVVAGDVEPKEVRRLTMRYYGGMKDVRPKERGWSNEPPMLAAKTVAMEDARVKQRQWMRTYTVPSVGTVGLVNDTVALELAASWLGSGKASVLYQRLVEEEKLAVDISARYYDTLIGPGGFTIRATPRDGVSLVTLQSAIERTLQAALQAGPDAEQVERAKTLYRADITYAQDGLTNIANYIGALYMVGKDEQHFYALPSLLDQVSGEDVQRVAREHLRTKFSVTGTLVPEETPLPSGPTAPAEAPQDSGEGLS